MGEALERPVPKFNFEMPFPLWLEYYIANSAKRNDKPGSRSQWNANNIADAIKQLPRRVGADGRSVVRKGGRKGVEKILSGQSSGVEIGKNIIEALLTSADEKVRKNWRLCLSDALEKWNSAELSGISSQQRLQFLGNEITRLGLPADDDQRLKEFRRWHEIGAKAVNEQIETLENRRKKAKLKKQAGQAALFLGALGGLVIAWLGIQYFFVTPFQLLHIIELRDPQYYRQHRRIASELRELIPADRKIIELLYPPIWQDHVYEKIANGLSKRLVLKMRELEDQNAYLATIKKRYDDKSLYHEEKFIRIFDAKSAKLMPRSRVFFDQTVVKMIEANDLLLRGLAQLKKLADEPAPCRYVFVVEKNDKAFFWPEPDPVHMIMRHNARNREQANLVKDRKITTIMEAWWFDNNEGEFAAALNAQNILWYISDKTYNTEFCQSEQRIELELP